MNNTIETQNCFYKTFTPFLSAETKTAEKTLNLENNSQMKLAKNKINNPSAWKNMAAGGFILVPMLALLCSRTSLNKMKRGLHADYFNAVNNKPPGGFLNETAKYLRVLKTGIVEGVTSLTKPFRDKKDKFFQKLNAPDNNTFSARMVKKINQFFIQRRLSILNKQNQKVRNLFVKLEKNLEKQLNIISASGEGKVKVLFPSSLRRNVADELPKVVDFSKTATGKDRAQEIRKLINEVKTILSKEKTLSPEILKRISYSSEDIYKEANSLLNSLFIDLRNNSPYYKLTRPKIKIFFDELTAYRYAELFTNSTDNTSVLRRSEYVKNMQIQLGFFKDNIPKGSSARVYVDKLDELITHASSIENAGLLEKIRLLLKCDDIKSEFVKSGVKPALFKYFQPDEYIHTKKLLNDFVKELNRLNKFQKQIVPLNLEEIANGKLYVHALATLLPAVAIGGRALNSSIESNKTKHKRNFYSFLVGSSTMLLAHNLFIIPKVKAIILGLLATWGTAKMYDKIKK